MLAASTPWSSPAQALTLAQHIESGASQQAWPALVIDLAWMSPFSLFLNANSASDSTANMVVRSGSLTVEDMAFTTGDAPASREVR